MSDAMGWEEATWIANRNRREALGLALTACSRTEKSVERGLRSPRWLVILSRTILDLILMIAQAFFYNAIFFT